MNLYSKSSMIAWCEEEKLKLNHHFIFDQVSKFKNGSQNVIGSHV